jgi:hypothetical protein
LLIQSLIQFIKHLYPAISPAIWQAFKKNAIPCQDGILIGQGAKGVKIFLPLRFAGCPDIEPDAT